MESTNSVALLNSFKQATNTGEEATQTLTDRRL